MHPPCPGPIMRGLGGFIHSSCELRHLLRAPLHTYCTAYIQCLCLICPYYKIISIKCTNHLEKRSNLHMSESNQISEEVVFPETWQIHTHVKSQSDSILLGISLLPSTIGHLPRTSRAIARTSSRFCFVLALCAQCARSHWTHSCHRTYKIGIEDEKAPIVVSQTQGEVQPWLADLPPQNFKI